MKAQRKLIKDWHRKASELYEHAERETDPFVQISMRCKATVLYRVVVELDEAMSEDADQDLL